MPPTHEIDKLVGKRIRLRREALGLSPRHFGLMLGLTYYQVQKYENGKAPLSVGRLYKIAVVLKVPIGHLLENFGSYEHEEMGHQPDDERELVRLFGSIEDGVVRQSLLELMRSINRDAEPRRRLERLRQE